MVVSNVGSVAATDVVLDVVGGPPNISGQYRISAIPASGQAVVYLPRAPQIAPLFFAGVARSAQQDANYANNVRVSVTG